MKIEYNKNNPLRGFFAFAGYNSQMMALNRVAERHNGEIDFDLVGWSEIDKYAIKAHDLIFIERIQDRYV